MSEEEIGKPSEEETVKEAADKEPRETIEEAVDEGERHALWKEGLVQEALGSRPELKGFGQPRDFAASRREGYDRGFEDAARTLTMNQLKAFEDLKARRLARYVRHELPGELHARLDELGAGWDEAGFLAGYVEGVTDFVDEVRRRTHE